MPRSSARARQEVDNNDGEWFFSVLVLNWPGKTREEVRAATEKVAVAAHFNGARLVGVEVPRGPQGEGTSLV